ncbi:unnamed protein product, partial [Iphiclides podalirius]
MGHQQHPNNGTTESISFAYPINKLKALDPQDLVDLPETIATFDDANRAIASLRETITSAVTDSETDASRTVKLSGDRRFNFPSDLRLLIRQKNAAKRAFDRYRSESNRTLLRRLQLEVKDRVSEHRHTTWDTLVEDIEPSHTAYWRLARSLKADPRESLPPCSFPDDWKQATVIGIRKPNKPANKPSSYRPISLLSCLGKLYERLLLNRLKVHLYRLKEHILKGLNHPKHISTGALFFDVAKAFDKVWNNGLLYKQYTLKVPDRLVHTIRAFLLNRSFRYRVEGTLSTSRRLTAGVPQGSCLSPLLFTLYTSDIPRDPHVNLALFADDTALFYSDRNLSQLTTRLQSAADGLGDWFRKWRIDINPEKSVAIHFTRSTPNPHPPNRYKGPRQYRKLGQISLYGQTLPWEKTVKYLGVTFDSRMTFTTHINQVRNKAAFVSGRLHNLPNKHSEMPLRHKLLLYKACSPASSQPSGGKRSKLPTGHKRERKQASPAKRPHRPGRRRGLRYDGPTAGGPAG